MGISKCYTAHLAGLTAEVITVEVDISNGLNSVSIVGLGDRAVEEAKDRISAAIKNSGYVSPKQKNQRVVIALAPADIRKEGPAFDLPMAISYLAAAGDVVFSPTESLFIGELSLEGEVRKVSGVLPILCQASKHGFRSAFVPQANAREAELADGIEVFAVSSLRETISILQGESLPLVAIRPRSAWPAANETDVVGEVDENLDCHDMRAIRGNESAKRGMEIAAAGGHNILMYGPPGTGKTMLAQSFPSILPPLSREESIEVTGIHSAARVLGAEMISRPPFRAPHHTASYPAIVGGGMFPHPGEITLAHRGVLFLDELPEFDRSVLEALRQPLEERSITVARARGTVTFPAQCMLIASMNPCPCGKPKGDGCDCPDGLLRTYRRKVSGPITDRIDIWVGVSKVDYQKLAARAADAEPSATIRKRVVRARTIQEERFRQHGIPHKRLNSEMSAEDIEKCLLIDDAARAMLAEFAERLKMSGRGFHRVIKTARTIADLAGEDKISLTHVLEAMQYRQKL